MIKKIRTPDEVFRREKTDIYFLDFREKRESQKQKTQIEIQSWIREHLPEVKTEILGPFEDSAYVEGGPLMLRLIFSDNDLKKFCAEWEDQDGKSITKRFQLCQISYHDWLSDKSK